MKIKKFEEIEIGQSAELNREISEEDIQIFADLSGDHNPIHMDEDFAKNTIFKGRIAHGILSTAFISTLLARDLPGPGTIYLSQNVIFKRPVRINDTITAKVEVIEKNEEKSQIKLRTTCVNQNGKLVVDGQALVMLMENKS
jgi:3-hydroxybutyryl-CoA dehydratase